MKIGLAALVGAATMTLAGVAAAQSESIPRLQVVDRSPLIVHGTGFGARERVAVTVTVDSERTRRGVIATFRGTFTARFDEIRLDGCTGATLFAAGRRSEEVRLKIGLRECPGPALDPYP
jgi:hypothetical protein